jgi:hypothetical protein
MRVLLISKWISRADGSELVQARPGDPIYGHRFDLIIVVGAADPTWVERVVMCRLAPRGRYIALP